MDIKIQFDETELESTLRSFYTITGIRIVVFDDQCRKIAAYPTEHLPYCSELRKDPAARDACRMSDLEGCRKCRSLRKMYLYECHAGLREVVLPMIDGNVMFGYLMLGEVILGDEQKREEIWEELQQKVSGRRIDFDQLRPIFEKNPILSREYLYAAARIMETCASHLYLKQAISVKDEDLSKQVDDYIRKHYSEDLSAESISSYFGISRSRLYRVTEHSFGKGIMEQIRSIRIDVACRLLKETDLKIADISARIGYEDYNYFTKIFKRKCGVTPREYRKQYGIIR